jgi:hypothetical protein
MVDISIFIPTYPHIPLLSNLLRVVGFRHLVGLCRVMKILAYKSETSVITGFFQFGRASRDIHAAKKFTGGVNILIQLQISTTTGRRRAGELRVSMPSIRERSAKFYRLSPITPHASFQSAMRFAEIA